MNIWPPEKPIHVVCDIEDCINFAERKIVISNLDGSSPVDYYLCSHNTNEVMKCLKGDINKIRTRLKHIV